METRKKVKKPMYKRVWFWILVALALFFLIPFSIGVGRGIRGDTVSEPEATVVAQAVTETPAATAIATAAPTPELTDAITESPAAMPTIAPTATPKETSTPKPTPSPTPKTTAAPTPTPTPTSAPTAEPSASEKDKSLYRDFMWLLMHEQLDRPEDELKKEFAKANDMSVAELDELIRRVQIFVYAKDRDPRNEHEFSSFGELESIVDYFDGVCVLAYVIEPSLTKKATIEQNFFNVENFIVDGGGDIYKQIQYHAFMITTTGERLKAVTFTVDADLIAAIKSRDVLATAMSEYLDDLWVTSQLR